MEYAFVIFMKYCSSIEVVIKTKCSVDAVLSLVILSSIENCSAVFKLYCIASG
jgi:hypothetical protein